MRTVEIHTIEFKTAEEASKNENYPNSGLFIVREKGGTSNLRIVDKAVSHNFCIVPESTFNGICLFNETTELPAIQEPTSEQKYEGDFILEFSRILLNRK